MSDDMMIQILTGPVAALALCLFAIYYVVRWMAMHIPKWVERHMGQIDRIVESHNEDRAAYQEGLQTLNMSLQELSGEMKTIRDDVQEIKRDIKVKAEPVQLTPPH